MMWWPCGYCNIRYAVTSERHILCMAAKSTVFYSEKCPKFLGLLLSCIPILTAVVVQGGADEAIR